MPPEKKEPCKEAVEYARRIAAAYGKMEWEDMRWSEERRIAWAYDAGKNAR